MENFWHRHGKRAKKWLLLKKKSAKKAKPRCRSNRAFLLKQEYTVGTVPTVLNKGLVVDDADLIGFPQNRFQMELYYDGECFIYTDGTSKFIVHPNYQMKVSREVVKLVNFITATRRTDKKEFNGKRYVKI